MSHFICLNHEAHKIPTRIVKTLKKSSPLIFHALQVRIFRQVRIFYAFSSFSSLLRVFAKSPLSCFSLFFAFFVIFMLFSRFYEFFAFFAIFYKFTRLSQNALKSATVSIFRRTYIPLVFFIKNDHRQGILGEPLV
jgi:hypothetical protein